MLDPLVSLAFNVQANRGVYALLLGSGLSRPAAILTGWEIVFDLIRRYAKIAGEDCEPDPERWYKERFGQDPSYPVLLSELGKTRAERRQILHSYFEANPEEREAGLKTPTAAHRAIARLVAGGYLRVIVTTNFDRLLEQALGEAGVTPTVVSTDDQAAGAVPLQHCQCVIVKPNGDYMDIRIRNTPDELTTYEPNLSALLDRIWDEYGLIVCGWSGDWDTGLRGGLERMKNRRFGVYWTARGELKGAAAQLTEHLRATAIDIRDADGFFTDLTEKVLSVEGTGARHPLTSRIAVATLKRLLPDPLQEIRLRDLVSDEVESLWKELAPARFPSAVATSLAAPLAREISHRLDRYEALTDTLLQMLCAGITFANDARVTTLDSIWLKAIERIATAQNHEAGGHRHLIELRGYPALLLLYGAGLAALAHQRLALLFHIMLLPIQDESGEKPLMRRKPIGSPDIFTMLSREGRRPMTLSDRLHGTLREPLRRYISDDEEYERMFDRFEYLLSIVCLSATGFAPQGRFIWRRGRHGWRVHKELSDLTPYWSAAAKLLPKDSTQFWEAAQRINEKIEDA